MNVLVEKVEIPDGVVAELKGNDFSAKGKGGENNRHFKSIKVVLKKNDSIIEVWSKDEKRDSLAESKTIASHIKNMMHGTMEDYKYTMEVVFSHFPMNVSVKGNFVEINNLAGAKHPKKARIMEGVKVEIKGKDITVTGHNKEAVGQTAANMEQATKIRGKDVRVFTDGIYITSKPEKK